MRRARDTQMAWFALYALMPLRTYACHAASPCVSSTALACGYSCDVGYPSSSASHATLTTIAQYFFWSPIIMAWLSAGHMRFT